MKEHEVRALPEQWYKKFHFSIILKAHCTYEDAGGSCLFPLDRTISIPGLNAGFNVLPIFDSPIFSSSMMPDY